MDQINKDNKEIKIKLLRIQETAFFINVPLLKNLKEGTTPNKFSIQIGFNLPKNNTGNTFELKTIVRYLNLQEVSPENKDIKSLENKVLELETSNIFEFDDLNQYLSFEDGSIKDNSGVVNIMLGVSIGALRGILLTKTAGTYLSNHPLPIINTEIFMNPSDNENNEGGDASEHIEDFSTEKE